MGQVQGISISQNKSVESQESQIPFLLKALIATVAAVASAAIGFLLASLAGLAIGALVGTGLGFTAIAITNNFMRQPKADLDLAQKNASVNDQAKKTEILTSQKNKLEAQRPKSGNSPSFKKLDPNDNQSPLMKIGVFDAEGNKLEALPTTFAQNTTSHSPSLTNRDQNDNQHLFPLPQVNEMEIPGFEPLGFMGSITDDDVVEGVEGNEVQDSTNVRDQLDKDLIQFYHLLPIEEKPHLDGSISDQAEGIRIWMNQNPEALKVKFLLLPPSTLRRLPKEIGLFVHLIRLTLNDHNIESLPPEIGNLHSLVYLSLSNNMLQSLPAEIGKLDSLKILIISSNQIEDLPAEIDNLRSLERLDLSLNYFDSIPPNIGKLPSLQSINLFNNQIPDFPAKINNLEYKGGGVYELCAKVE